MSTWNVQVSEGLWVVLLGAAVMEETRPPSVVVSWAATKDAAARMASCENFMVKDFVWRSLLID